MPTPSADVFAPIVRSLRRNLLPGLFLQALAITFIAAYLGSSRARAVFNAIGAVKAQYGYAFSAASTMLFGGIVPFVVLIGTGRVTRAFVWRTLLFYVVFWTWKGIEVDAFYRMQAFIFGNAASVSTIAKKIIVDQLVYNPLWAGPTQVWFFLWKECGFSRRAMRPHFAEQSLGLRVVIVVVSSWLVWIPTVAVIYALPVALQVPLFNIIICFWSLLLTSLSKPDE